MYIKKDTCYDENELCAQSIDIVLGLEWTSRRQVWWLYKRTHPNTDVQPKEWMLKVRILPKSMDTFLAYDLLENWLI